MSRSSAPRPSRRHPHLLGGVLGVMAWLVLSAAPVLAQAMTRIDSGVPGAVICSAGKLAGKDGGTAAMPHCQLCTLAQQMVDMPSLAGDVALPAPAAASLVSRPVDMPPPRAPPRAHPPRAPPLS